MTLDEFKILYVRKKRWHDKLWNLAKDIPKFRSAQTERDKRILRIWENFYVKEWVPILLAKDDACMYYLGTFIKWEDE